jgi:hypothetical protein
MDGIRVAGYLPERSAIKLGTVLSTCSPKSADDDFVVIERVVEVKGNSSQENPSHAWDR